MSDDDDPITLDDATKLYPRITWKSRAPVFAKAESNQTATGASPQGERNFPQKVLLGVARQVRFESAFGFFNSDQE